MEEEMKRLALVQAQLQAARLARERREEMPADAPDEPLMHNGIGRPSISDDPSDPMARHRQMQRAAEEALRKSEEISELVMRRMNEDIGSASRAKDGAQEQPEWRKRHLEKLHQLGQELWVGGSQENLTEERAPRPFDLDEAVASSRKNQEIMAKIAQEQPLRDAAKMPMDFLGKRDGDPADK